MYVQTFRLIYTFEFHDVVPWYTSDKIVCSEVIA